MSKFYGTVQGQRGKATRAGHHSITTEAASWEGAVRVHVYHDEDRGQDVAIVSLTRWHGEGSQRVLWEGPVSGKRLKRVRG